MKWIHLPLVLVLVLPASAQKMDAADIVKGIEKDVCAVKNYDPKSATEAEGICLDCIYGTQSTPSLPKGKAIERALKLEEREQKRLEREFKFWEAIESVGYGFSLGTGTLDSLKSLVQNYKLTYDKLGDQIKEAKKSPEEKQETIKQIQEATDQGKMSPGVKKFLAQVNNGNLENAMTSIKSYKILIGSLKKQANLALGTSGEEAAISAMKTYETYFSTVMDSQTPYIEAQQWIEKGGGLPIPNQIQSALSTYKYTLDNSEQIIKTNENQMQAYQQEIEKMENQIKLIENPTAPVPVKVSFSSSELSEKVKKYEEKYKAEASITNPGFKDCGMSVAEVYALRWYTGSGYGAFNSALRSGGENAKKYEPIKIVLNEALKKLAPYKGEVVRGTTLPAAVAAEHTPGAILNYPSFTSTGIGSGFGGSQKFIILSKKGRYVGSHSSNYGEKEVLFAADTKFKILEVEGNKITMEEVEE